MGCERLREIGTLGPRTTVELDQNFQTASTCGNVRRQQVKAVVQSPVSRRTRPPQPHAHLPPTVSQTVRLLRVACESAKLIDCLNCRSISIFHEEERVIPSAPERSTMQSHNSQGSCRRPARTPQPSPRVLVRHSMFFDEPLRCSPLSRRRFTVMLEQTSSWYLTSSASPTNRPYGHTMRALASVVWPKLMAFPVVEFMWTCRWSLWEMSRRQTWRSNFVRVNEQISGRLGKRTSSVNMSSERVFWSGVWRDGAAGGCCGAGWEGCNMAREDGQM